MDSGNDSEDVVCCSAADDGGPYCVVKATAEAQVTQGSGCRRLIGAEGLGQRLELCTSGKSYSIE